ncbi:MAG: phenylalanine--tRNA ligase subunit beta [Lysobacterales bacterium 69-70]|nr:phenylalanine--tRNA ligase subunit beta [Xanthomonadaceae bacterium]ODU36190.1 MAG: phenylalanine--tRNA ligase subunit beta [Xanthomonadaceae bacterium SCN 69-320]ODV17892.1 MAG: phenylalanine--tRNA ligase subunit beta [Xanthomonadaceae bacterium SCN 69-25]OJY99352.1 MAG: phenylalanine--tRNA ligase subunit beta [Xanthomonadales bacterium 69-70]
MKFSENWLRSLVNPAVDRDTLCHRLTMAGLEVEGVEALGDGLAGVRIGEIVECDKHPNADKLRVCRVSIGEGEPLQIVCGAPNARPGLKAPVATIGAQLPNGMAIKQAALRGVDSFGMLCSAKELGLDADASGLMELPADAPAGLALADYLALPDASIELKMTPNRPDCLGLRGLAYDVAALFGAPLQDVSAAPVQIGSAAVRGVHLDAAADCPRYLGRVIEGITPAAASPLWLKERLRRAGLRPISAVVDVTAYVMLELGQPMHAFDNARLDGDIHARRATAGEKLALLDGSEVTLDDSFLVIADTARAVALAGIMGGLDSRVTDTTIDVFLESAHFAPASIMGRARKLGLHTDASHRFERGVDPDLPRLALERATELLLQIVGGKAGPVVEAVAPDHLPMREAVPLRRQRLSRVLGMDVADAEVERILRALGMDVQTAGQGWLVTPPSRRFDIEIEEDLIEEVVRVHGYERVPTRSPSGQLRLSLPPEARVPAERVRMQLVADGYYEAVCYSFVAKDWLQRWSREAGAVALANPLSADLAVMRTSLLPGLVEALKHNANRQQERIRLFEIARVFQAGSDAPLETRRVAAVACGRALPEHWGGDKRAVDYYDLKADLEKLVALAGGRADFHPADRPEFHPGRSAEVRVNGAFLGYLGALHPRLLKALDLDQDVYAFELDLDGLTAGRLPEAAELSRFPQVRRDIAVVLPEAVAWGQVETVLRGVGGAVLRDLLVFDRYSGTGLGSGLKSLAIGLILQDSYRTLTDQEADHLVASALAALERECGGRLRG